MDYAIIRRVEKKTFRQISHCQIFAKSQGKISKIQFESKIDGCSLRTIGYLGPMENSRRLRRVFKSIFSAQPLIGCFSTSIDLIG